MRTFPTIKKLFTAVYDYNYCFSGHYPLCFYLKHNNLETGYLVLVLVSRGNGLVVSTGPK